MANGFIVITALVLSLLRKEPRRQGWFWYAYLRSHGLLHKRYVGKSERLTIARLEEMATILNELW